MAEDNFTFTTFYTCWKEYQDHIKGALAPLTAEQKDSTLKRSGYSPIHRRVFTCATLMESVFVLPHQRGTCLSLLATRYLSLRISWEPQGPEVILSRAQRAHYRLSWEERLARNASVPTTSQVTISLFGVPAAFAAFLGLRTP